MKLSIQRPPLCMRDNINMKGAWCLCITWNDHEFDFDYKFIANNLLIKSGHLYSIAEKCGCKKINDMLVSNDRINVEKFIDELGPWEVIMCISDE